MGAEGPTDDPEINDLRERQMRNFLATMMLTQGVPMLAGGDEIARSQRGNNNAYCQDNELTWYDWQLDGHRKRLLELAPTEDPADPQSRRRLGIWKNLRRIA